MSRLLVLTYSFGRGGSELHVYKLASRLPYSFMWIAMNETKTSIRSDVEALDNCDGTHIAAQPSFGDYLKYVRRFIQDNGSVRHLYAIGFLPSLCAVLMKLWHRHLVVTTARREMMPWKKWFHVPFLWLINFFSDRIETNSQFLMRQIPKEPFTNSKVYWFPNILHSSILKPVKDARFDTFSKYRFKIGLVANVRPEKNIPTFVDVAKDIAERYPDVAIALVGKDNNQGYLSQMALPDNVYFFDEVPFESVGHFYSLLDVFLFTSLHEGCPNAIVEALSYGIPIVTSRIPATSFLEGGVHALFCEPTVSSEYSDAIDVLLKDEKRRVEMAACNRTLFESHFSEASVQTAIRSYF